MRKEKVFLLLSIFFFILAVFIFVRGYIIYVSTDQSNQNELIKSAVIGISAQIQAGVFIILSFISLVCILFKKN